MVQPNEACAYFCRWMLHISKQHLSGPQHVLVTTVFNSAIDQVPISDQDWYNFNLFTAWRDPYYIVYRDYARQVYPSLNVDLLAAWSFEGTTDAVFGAYPDTVLTVTTSLNNGRVLRGANFQGAGYYIAPSIVYLPVAYTLSFWLKIPAYRIQAQALFIDYGFGRGSYIDEVTNKIVITGATILTSTLPVPLNTWLHVIITNDVTGGHIYFNTLDVSDSNPVLNQGYIGTFSSPGITYFYQGSMDAINIWSRVLTSDERNDLYQDRLGLQYPFV